MKHGPENYYFKDGDKISRVVGSLFSRDTLKYSFGRIKKILSHPPWMDTHYQKPEQPNDNDDPYPSTIPDPHKKPPKRIFCRLFEKGTQPNATGLIDLGLAIETETFAMITVAGDSDIPGGYTYLGQFIDHDITATPQEMELSPDGVIDPEAFFNQRTPSLDLDSVYGMGPVDSPDMYEADKVHLKVGLTSPTPVGPPGGPIPGGTPNDLPRKSDTDPTAIIGDGRNDENLAVAQTHVAFLKFHNKIVDEIQASTGLSGQALFDAARKEVVLHYQSIVMTDFLPRIMEQGVLQDVLINGRKFYKDDLAQCMPIEFSVAAYRLGHSMVRPQYEWNRVFNSLAGGVPATFDLLFEFSGVSGTRTPNPDDDPPFFGLPTLPSNWVVDWTRMYDFSGVQGVSSHPDMNLTREIDASLAMDLSTLPEIQRDPKVAAMPDEEKKILFSLATRNLLRGRLMELATGQQVAEAMTHAGINFVPITPEEIAAGPHTAIVEANNFHNETPLWYYVLREAKIRHDGTSLGPVGSRILAETFIGLVSNSKINIFKDQPGLTFSMPELLAKVGDLNPLGN